MQEKSNIKNEVFKKIAKQLELDGFKIVDRDEERPWGGFFVIDEQQSQLFIKNFFNNISIETIKKSGKISPKILFVSPHKRLSWQYHFRRAEIWKVVQGKVGVIRSMNDKEQEMQIYQTDDLIKLEQLERHRLIGLAEWAIIAEIWLHTDPENPSDENDIVRLQDDFGR